MATMKDIIQSPLLLALVIGGLLYISAFSLVYLKKAYDHCLELGITRKELSNVIKSSLIFSVVPSLSIVVGLFVLIAVLGSVWAWWRLSVIGSLSYETMISSSIAQVLGYASSAEMLESATGRQFGDDPDERGYAERFPDPAAPRQKAVQERGPLCSRKRRQHLEKRAVRRVHACDVLGIHSHSAVH